MKTYAAIWSPTYQNLQILEQQRRARMGAALAYYTAFSIAPLLIIALSVIGLIYKGDSLGYIHNQIAGLIGANAAEAVTGAIRSIRTSEHGTMANVISVIVLFVGASSVFAQLQTTLNRIWAFIRNPIVFGKTCSSNGSLHSRWCWASASCCWCRCCSALSCRR
jgi:membrane protein